MEAVLGLLAAVVGLLVLFAVMDAAKGFFAALGGLALAVGIVGLAATDGETRWAFAVACCGLALIWLVSELWDDGRAPRETVVREAIPQRVRHDVWRRDQGTCARCGSRTRLEYDHIIPVSQGGSNTARNIELLCEACNRRKGANIAG